MNFLKITALFFFILSVQPATAQRKKKKSKKAETTQNKDEKSITDLTKKSRKFDGLFTIYQDTTDGSIKMTVKENQIGKEFIYFSQNTDGLASSRTNRGSYRGSKVIRIQKYFDKIEFIEVNTSSYFNPNNAISKASEANMPNAIIASVKILAQNDTTFLIDANKLFLSETFSQVKPPKRPGTSPYSFSLGTLNKEKTKINNIRNYPENTDIEVEYVYSKSSVLNGGKRDVTDARNVSLKVYHSLIKMPKNEYQPLFEDPRVGFFTTQVTDMTSPKNANYRDLVHRWNLVKKDPNAAISEPIEPIVWWMENTTPENLRPLIRSAAESWNIAFEKAGFKNAIVIKQQPDDAEWDAGDIRYNVLRWTASPFPPFGGYGPSFVNPRTGQILGADIMFEFRSVLGRMRLEKFYDGDTKQHELHGCQASLYGAINNAFAGLVLEYIDGEPMENSQMIKEFIHYLILHEIGHTLGLSHNMKASQMLSIAELNNEKIVKEKGLMGSVMDYPAVNAAKNRKEQGLYYTTRPGPYDLWAIQFAYEQGRTEEETEKLLNRSTEHDLLFGNDADDMRSPGKAIDPMVNVFDLSSDAIQYGIDRIELVKELSENILKKYNEEGTSHHDQRIAYLAILRQYRDVANVTSRYIGGIYVDRAMIGQEGAKQPYTPVDILTQKKAMQSLKENIFAIDAMQFPAEIYSNAAAQRRGFNFFSQSEDIKIHDRVLSIQMGPLNHILHPNTLERIINTQIYGNKYKISDVFQDLTNSIFKDDISGSVNTFRQNLQLAYTQKLIQIIVGKSSTRYSNVAKSLAIYYLNEIRKMANNSTGDISSKAHKKHLVTLIDNALKEVK